ncbi:MAG: hypothetical protein VX871_12050 [Pseudomonadota bacterium]|nr:hypothetical protein [Pseudomonadota bacterium]
MQQNIRLAVIGNDEPIALRSVEPLDGPGNLYRIDSVFECFMRLLFIPYVWRIIVHHAAHPRSTRFRSTFHLLPRMVRAAEFSAENSIPIPVGQWKFGAGLFLHKACGHDATSSTRAKHMIFRNQDIRAWGNLLGSTRAASERLRHACCKKVTKPRAARVTNAPIRAA